MSGKSKDLLPARVEKDEGEDAKLSILSTVLRLAPPVLGVAGNVAAVRRAGQAAPGMGQAVPGAMPVAATPPAVPAQQSSGILRPVIYVGFGAALVAGGLGAWWWLKHRQSSAQQKA